MKKKDIIDLIRYHFDGNESAFKELAYDIAIEFNEQGDTTIGGYLISIINSRGSLSSFVPQNASFFSDFFSKLDSSSDLLKLPDSLLVDIKGICNAVGYKQGINKFLFTGAPGTGKTETARHLARILNRNLYSVNFAYVIDSKLGQSAKNISSLFDEINNQSFPESLIILFDEIDVIAMDRINSNDLREMGRVTSTLMKGLDELNPNIIVLATTNLINSFDKALLRRFDKIVDFNRYSRSDLLDVADSIMEMDLRKFKFPIRNMKLSRKIIDLYDTIPYPGDLKNLIRNAIAFSNPNDQNDYLKLLISEIMPDYKTNYKLLQDKGFTLREIELLTDISKSTLSRSFNKE